MKTNIILYYNPKSDISQLDTYPNRQASVKSVKNVKLSSVNGSVEPVLMSVFDYRYL